MTSWINTNHINIIHVGQYVGPHSTITYRSIFRLQGEKCPRNVLVPSISTSKYLVIDSIQYITPPDAFHISKRLRTQVCVCNRQDAQIFSPTWWCPCHLTPISLTPPGVSGSVWGGTWSSVHWSEPRSPVATAEPAWETSWALRWLTDVTYCTSY